MVAIGTGTYNFQEKIEEPYGDIENMVLSSNEKLYMMLGLRYLTAAHIWDLLWILCGLSEFAFIHR